MVPATSRREETAMTEWTPFFAALAGAAAIVFTVAFATLALGSGRWRSTVLRPAAVALALLQLLVPLAAALIALVPGDRSWQVGYLVMGSVGLLGQMAYVARYLRDEDAADGFDQRQLQWGLPLSTCVYLSMLAFSARPQVHSPRVVAGLSIWLLVSGTLMTWLLLTWDDERPAPTRPPVPAAPQRAHGATAVHAN
jgi:hypothetical protein